MPNNFKIVWLNNFWTKALSTHRWSKKRRKKKKLFVLWLWSKKPDVGKLIPKVDVLFTFERNKRMTWFLKFLTYKIGWFLCWIQSNFSPFSSHHFRTISILFFSLNLLHFFLLKVHFRLVLGQFCPISSFFQSHYLGPRYF